MSTLLRIEMIVIALLIVTIIVRSVNRKKLRIQYSFAWLIIAAALMVIALFPGVVVWLCGITGIETPSNLIYLFGILILLLISFYQTVLLSKQADRITRLTQVLSIERFYREQQEQKETVNDE
ncbi:MAG: DUF2304 domain-containing protein [Lawsonibacter sp.]|jgi:hypothetical protein|nr:DUF2304 domain-containing protein [Lawsonibacter sp.]